MVLHPNIPACTYCNGYLLQYQRLAALLLTTLPYRGGTRDIKLS